MMAVPSEIGVAAKMAASTVFQKAGATAVA
jgi:hypothetical protein